ncbi:hypothetical protein GV792_04575 [Nocardia cyriacigeorgica]|uniref:hypothetical protein n=1 Tax=Nocardia cyriacigeorgica TaxID=135487 RepID=UPI0013BE4DB3|nr:hypothetical protein [Nocardia cyriacigeorgica]NEW49318.1 hypothetical protein [Nocardia cyriacigeorgica]
MTQPPPTIKPAKSQRGLWIALAVLAVAALVGGGILVAMTVTDDPPATTAAAPKTTALGIGTPVAFARADTGAAIGTITFTDATVVPAECVIDPVPGTQALALHVEIDNTGTVALSTPDMYSMTTLDGAGVTQPTENGTLTSACLPRWPEGADAGVGRKTVEWVVLQVQPNPVVLQYTPLVASENASLENWEFVKASPLTAKIALPAPLAIAAPAPAPTTTVQVETTDPTVAPTTRAAAPTKAAPAAGVGCDPSVDNWALDAAGGQLKCAYAGGPTPKWVNSAPFIGIRQPGSRCSYDDGVAESPSGQTLMCTGDRDSAVWTPGP